MFFRSLFLLICFVNLSLFSEIKKIALRWTPEICDRTCGRLFQERLLKIKDVEEVTINLAAGQADVKWSKEKKFSYVPINWAMRYVGLRVRDIHVEATGRIFDDGKRVWLISSGDGTRFELLGSIIPRYYQFEVEESTENRNLTPRIYAQLMEGMRNRETATIEGPLFQPNRSPPSPLRLIIATLKFSKKEEEEE